MPDSPASNRTLEELAFDISIATERLRARWRNQLGISAYEMLAITHIQHGEGLTIGELGSRLALSSGAMTGLIDRLAKTGRVERVRDELDRRRVHLMVTDAARADLERLSAPLNRRVAALSREPQGDARVMLAGLLACYTKTLEEIV